MKILFAQLITLYQKFASPIIVSLFGNACRFDPTCSEYSKQAILKYGVKKGFRLSLNRLSKCHPFSHKFGIDPLS